MKLEQRARETPGKPACIVPGERALTYGELHARSAQLANHLRASGLGQGDAMAILLENRAEYLVALWGAHRAGVSFVPINTRLKLAEVDYILDDSRAVALFASSATRELIDRLTPRAELAVRVSVDDDLPGFRALDDVFVVQPATRPAGVTPGRDLMYSSGTTGRPKAVDTAISGDLDQVMAQLYAVTADDVYLSPAPMYHTAPSRTMFAMTQMGVTTVLMPRFDAREFLDLVERHRVTITQVVPTMFVRMLRLPDRVRAGADISSLRAVLHNAAPCPILVKEQMIDWFGPILYESYAATEGHGYTFCDSHDWLSHRGTVGRASLGTIHIVSDDGDELPPGQVGTVYFGGGFPFSYRNEPDKTAGTRDPRGWATVGDVGYVDGEGYLYLTDRKANMIICGGVNVYPQETENVLVSHPAVVDAAVFGIPDSDLGEVVKAVVQLVDPLAAGPDLAAELLDHCREQLASIKCPRSIDFSDELPREPNGKLLKRLLRDPYWESHPRPAS
jgi:long-chain acyl-CoA synthetase